MQISILPLSRVPRAFIVSLVFLVALSASLLPAAAGITARKAAPAKSDKRQETNTTAAVPDEPNSPAAAYVVNDNGDAADINPGNGLCDTSPAAGDQCTLRAAIQEANALFGNDTITFSLPASSIITLNTALPDITGNLTITGPGANLLTVRRSTAAGTPDFRIFFTNNVTTSISGLTVTNGKTPVGDTGTTSGGGAKPGGGIWQAGGEMTLTDVVITGNRTGNGGEATGGSNSFGGGGGSGAASPRPARSR